MADITSNTPTPWQAPKSAGMEGFDAIYSGIDKKKLDLSFVYEGIPPKDIPSSEMQTRIRAATIASSISLSEKDSAAVYTEEFRRLSGMLPEQQKEYTTSRVKEEALRKAEKDMERSISQGMHALTVLASPTATTTNDLTAPPAGGGQYADTMARRLQLQAEAILQQQTAQGPYTAEAAVMGAGRKGNTYEDLALRRVIRDRAMVEALDALGYDTGDIVPWKAKSLWQGAKSLAGWGIEFLTGKYVVETHRYDTGAFDVAHIKDMPLDTYAASVEALKTKLIENKALPVTVVSAFSAYDPETSATLTGTFYALDFIPLLGMVRYGPKAVRAVQKARVIRNMSTSAGVAGQLGQMDVAGRLSARALLDKDVAKVGTDAVTGGMNASPFPWQPLDAAAVDGASHSTLKHLERERMYQSHLISGALSNADTVSLLRPGEIEAAEAAVKAKLPVGAEILERRPYNIKVRVTTPAPGKFATAEDLATAQKKYDYWVDTYNQASDELDAFYKETRESKWEPDAEWINRLENAKQKAKSEMEAADKVLTAGIAKDTVTESTIWYTKDRYTGQIDGVLEGNPIWNTLLSAEGRLKQIDSLLVSERTLILAQEEKLLTQLQKTMRSAVADLTGDSFRKVDSLLLHGSDQQKVFTAGQLERGVELPGVGTVKFNKKEIASYFKVRDTMDASHGLMSYGKYRELGQKGFTKQVFLNIVRPHPTDSTMEVIDQQKVFVKEFKHGTDAEGKVVLRTPDASKIIDYSSGKEAVVVGLKGDEAKDALKARLSKGNTSIVELERPVYIGDEGFNYMIVSNKRMKELTPDVLGYRKGYMPNIYKAIWAVRQGHKIKFDGKDVKEVQNTVRFFDTEDEAKAWRDAQVALNDGKTYTVNSDKNWRTLDPMYSAEVDDAVFSGMFLDYRGQKIPYGSAGTATPTESAFNAMDRYLENLGWSYPLNDWREGVLQRYFNTVNDYLNTPNDIKSTYKANVETNEKLKAALDAFRGYLTDQLSITSTGERDFVKWAKFTGENMEKSLFWSKFRKLPGGEMLYEKARLKALYGSGDANAFGVLRSLAFHVYLGAFNVAQLFVQASNMAVVTALHPLNAPAVIRRMLALRSVAFLNPTDPDYEKIVRIASKAALMKYDDFEPLVRSWHQSGWAYTTRSNADTRMAMRMMAPGGALRQDARAIQKVSLMFFTEGELWSRMYGWLDAFTRIEKGYKKAKKTVDVTSMPEVQKILKEATRVSFNYTAANAAHWQKGAWSIPTQFMQVPAKFYQELLMPVVSLGKYKSNFTAMETVRMLLGQAIMFGATGVPLFNFFKDNIYGMLTETAEDGTSLFPDADQNMATVFAGGFVDWISKQLMDLSYEEAQRAHPMVSSRMALANGFDLLVSNFTSQDWETRDALYTAVGKSLAGAAGGVMVQQVIPAFSIVMGVRDAQRGENSLNEDNWLRHMSRLAEITRSWDNIQTARMWEASRAILTKNGKVLLPIDPDGEDDSLILLKKMGFDSYERLGAIRMQEWLRKNNPEKEIKNALDAAQTLLLEYTRDDKLRSPDELDNYTRELAMLRSSLKSLDDKEKFDKGLDKILFDGTTVAGKSYKEMLQRVMEYDKGVLGPLPLETGLIEDQLQEDFVKGFK